MSKVHLKRRILYFLLLRKVSSLKKLIWNRILKINFHKFDSSYELLLLRLGFANSIRQARGYVKEGIFEINGRITTENKYLQNYDLVCASKNELEIHLNDSFYSRKHGGYILKIRCLVCSLLNYFLLLTYENEEGGIYANEKSLEGVLPYTSTMNFCNLSFIFFSSVVHNQWNFYIDFFSIKKFLQYNR